jgi:energy-converting hydrogenase Eha subunit C
MKKGGRKPKLSAPKRITWWIALAVGVVGVVLHLVPIAALPWLSVVGFWLVVAAFVLLLLATSLSGL